MNMAELNKRAEVLRQERNLKELKKLCTANGVDEEDAEDFMDGYIPEIFTPFIMAVAKIKDEKKKLDLPSEMEYYTDSIIELAKEPSLANAICSPNKALAGALAEILKVASKNRKQIPAAIVKAAGWNGTVYTGNIDRPTFKNVVTKYYTEG